MICSWIQGSFHSQYQTFVMLDFESFGKTLIHIVWHHNSEFYYNLHCLILQLTEAVPRAIFCAGMEAESLLRSEFVHSAVEGMYHVAGLLAAPEQIRSLLPIMSSHGSVVLQVKGSSDLCDHRQWSQHSQEVCTGRETATWVMELWEEVSGPHSIGDNEKEVDLMSLTILH